MKRIMLLGSLQDTARAVVRRLKLLTDSVVTYKHMSCATHILAYVWFALGLVPNGCTPQLLHGYFQLGNVTSRVRSVGMIGTIEELTW